MSPRPRRTTWADLRAARGWSLTELEERTGINRGELSRIERGSSCVAPDQARQLLRAYDDAEAGR